MLISKELEISSTEVAGGGSLAISERYKVWGLW